MTQPGMSTPPDKAVNFGSLAAWAAKPQEEWEDDLHGVEVNRWQPIIDALFGWLPEDLREGFEFTQAVLAAIARAITQSASSTLHGLELFARQILTLGGLIPVGHISDVPINLLDDPRFEKPDSISPVDGWVWDGTVSSTSTGGSAKVVANGFTQQLFHQTVVYVQPGNKLNLSAKVKTDSLAGDYTLVLSVAEYHDDAFMNTHEVATRTTAATTWTAMSGNYTVPADVTAIVARLAVVGATSGSAWFDDLDLHKTSLMPQSFVDGLTTMFNQLGDVFRGLIVVPINATVGYISDWFQTNVAQRLNLQSLFSGVDLTVGPEDFEPGLAVLTAAIDGAGAKISELLDGLRNAFAFGGSPASDVTVEQLTFVASEVRQKIVTTQDTVITVANLRDQPKNRPWWESPSPFEEVSVPRVLMQPRLNPSTLVYEKPSVTLANGTLYLIPARMRDNQVINEVGLLTLGDDPPPTALYLGLFSVDPDTGDHTLVYDFGDVKGDIDTGPEMLYEQRFQTTGDILGPAGEIFALGILPRGGSFRVAGVQREQIITSFTLYPQSSTEVLTGQTSLPSTVTETDLDHTFGYRVFASIGQTFTGAPEDITLLTLAETFNVVAGNWSSPSWLQFLSTNAKLYTDGSALRGGTTGPAVGDFSYWASALAQTKLNTDDQSVELTVGAATWNPNAYGFTTMRGYVRCKADGSTGVVMHLDSNGSSAGSARVQIANISNMISLGTVRATVAGLTAGPGDKFRLDAVDDTYQVYYNDDPIAGATWVDTGGLVVPVGKTWRYVGMGSGERTTVGAYHGIAGLDQWVAKDVAA